MPVSTDQLGLELNSFIEKNNLFISIPNNINWDSDRNIRLIHNKDSIIFNPDTKFYLKNISKPYYIMAYLYRDNQCIKCCFDLLGNLIQKVTDVKNKNGDIYRYSNTATIKLNSNGMMVYYEKNLKVNPISYTKKNLRSYLEDQKIGVLDLEVYNHSIDNISYVYSGGFYINMDKKPKLFYLDPITKDSDQLIIKIIDEMGKKRYQNFKFYCHNFGKYDVYFILKVLTKFNKISKDTMYKVETTMRDNVILK